MKALLGLFGASQLVIGALLWVTPGFFHEHVGPFGPRNDHYMGDLATWYLALGAAALAAVRWPRWRLPVLAVALAQNVLHAFNHLLDVGEADPSWIGPFDFVSLVLVSVLLAWMVSVERKAVR